MPGLMSLFEYYPTKPTESVLTVASYDNDGCLWLSYEVYCTRLLQKEQSLAKLPPQTLSLLNKAFANPNKPECWDNLQLKLSDEQNGIVQRLKPSILTADQYHQASKHFLTHGSLKGWDDETTISSEDRQALEKMLDEHYGLFNVNADIILSGSNRQCQRIDYYNSTKSNEAPKPSSVWVLSTIGQFLSRFRDKKITVASFLLADLWENKKFGTTAQDIREKHIDQKTGQYQEQNKANKSDTDNRIDSLAENDPHKWVLLYTQLHYLANCFPDRTIHFHFIDDRSDILNSLKKLFSENPSFIPFNVCLHLKQVNNTGLTEHDHQVFKPCRIQGEGPINHHWQSDGRYLIAQNTRQQSPLEHKQKQQYLQLVTDIASIDVPEKPIKRVILSECIKQIAQANARIAELKALKNTVETRNPRAAWRSPQAWKEWYQRQSLSNTFSLQAWSNWWQGKHHHNNELPIGMYPWETRTIFDDDLIKNSTNNGNSDTFSQYRYKVLGLANPFDVWPTKTQVINCIERDLSAANKQLPLLQKERDYWIEQHRSLVNGRIQEFMGQSKPQGECASDDEQNAPYFDLTGQCYAIKTAAGMHQNASEATLDTELINSEAEALTEGDPSLSFGYRVMTKIPENTEAFQTWLNGLVKGDSSNAGQVDTGDKHSEILPTLMSLQNTLDQYLCHSLRQFKSVFAANALTPAQWQHIFAAVRHKLIEQVKSQLKPTVSTQQAQEIQQQLPQKVLAEVIQVASKVKGFDAQYTACQAALKSRSPHWYSLLATVPVQKTNAPVDSSHRVLNTSNSLWTYCSALIWPDNRRVHPIPTIEH